MNSAAAILIAHNHPSGETSPSLQDLELTQRLRSAGELLGIPVLDHVVFTADGYESARSAELEVTIVEGGQTRRSPNRPLGSMRIPARSGHRFRRDPGTDSAMTRALNPEHPGA